MAIRAEWRSLLGRVSRRKAMQPDAPQAQRAVKDRTPAVQWKPHPGGSSAALAWLRSRNPHAAFVAGVLIGTLVIGVSAWLIGGHTFVLPSPGGSQAAGTLARFEQLTSAARPSLAQSEAESVAAGHELTAHLVADEEIVELQVGQHVRLAVRVDDVDALKPETLALIGGLPEAVQLSDGVRINTQLWMVRPDLLSSVEVDAARGPVGRYPLTLELRTPEGHVLSSVQTTLVIVAAVEDNAAGAQSAPIVAKDRGTAKPALSAQDKPAASATRTPVPSKSQAARTARPRIETPKPARQTQVRSAVSRPEPVQSSKPVRKARPVQPDATVSSGPPVVAQGPQSQQKLVWPGDNPRAAYTQNPPVFLGGALPNAVPQAQPAPVQDENWHRRVFAPGQ